MYRTKSLIMYIVYCLMNKIEQLFQIQSSKFQTHTQHRHRLIHNIRQIARWASNECNMHWRGVRYMCVYANGYGMVCGGAHWAMKRTNAWITFWTARNATHTYTYNHFSIYFIHMRRIHHYSRLVVYIIQFTHSTSLVDSIWCVIDACIMHIIMIFE